MKKILILSNSSSGLYEFRNELLLDMMSDHEVHVSLPEADKYYDKIASEGCIMHHTSFERRGMNPLKDIKLYKQYVKLIKETKPDMVCTYTIKPNIYGGLACRRMKVPYICNITGLGTAIQGGGILSKVLVSMYRVSTKKARVIFFQNEYNKSFMQERGIAVNNAGLLPGSGVNLDLHKYQPYPDEKDGVKILSVMRIMKDKGIEEYFQAVDRLGSDKLHFMLAGYYEEESRQEYEPILNRLVSEGKLTYLGYIDGMDEVYARSHIVLHPSYHEGLSNVCLEAAACGRPVLASNIPGCKETLTDGESGILFASRDSEAIIEAINDIMKMDSASREEMGRLGREHVKRNFDRKIVVEKYREIIGKEV